MSSVLKTKRKQHVTGDEDASSLKKQTTEPSIPEAQRAIASAVLPSASTSASHRRRPSSLSINWTNSSSSLLNTPSSSENEYKSAGSASPMSQSDSEQSRKSPSPVSISQKTASGSAVSQADPDPSQIPFDPEPEADIFWADFENLKIGDSKSKSQVSFGSSSVDASTQAFLQMLQSNQRK